MSSPPTKRRKEDDTPQTDWSEDFYRERDRSFKDRHGKRVKYCAYHGNSPETKLAIVTENPDDEKKRVKELREKSGTDKIKWEIFPIGKHGECSAEVVIKNVIDWGSTNVVINIEEDKRKYIVKALEGEGKRFTLGGIEYERLRGHSQGIYEAPSYLFGALRNTWEPSDAVLMSRVKTSDEGWKEKLIHLIKEKGIRKHPDSVITIIGGTRGSKDGISGFTDGDELYKEGAREDDKFIEELKENEETKRRRVERIGTQ